MYMTRTPKQRYGDYLHNDGGNTFAEYLGIEVPRLEIYNNKYRYRSSAATGSWEKLKKDAKASYKQALKSVKR